MCKILSDERAVERCRERLAETLRRLAVRAGNMKAARHVLASISGVSPAAQDALLYQRRGSARVLQRLQRAFLRVLLAGLRRDLEALGDELDVDAEDGLAELAHQARTAVAALEAALAQEEEGMSDAQ